MEHFSSEHVQGKLIWAAVWPVLFLCTKDSGLDCGNNKAVSRPIVRALPICLKGPTDHAEAVGADREPEKGFAKVAPILRTCSPPT